MTDSLGFVIRDGLTQDIPACLALDSSYQTEYVWQVSIQQETNLKRITFTTERLPRIMEVDYGHHESRLHMALEDTLCFLVAVERETGGLLGYLTMRSDPSHGIALIQDIVVNRPLRRHKMGSRLFKVARQWALEKGLSQVMVETQTKNYPAILFCQACGLTFCGFNDQYFRNQDIAVFFWQPLR